MVAPVHHVLVSKTRFSCGQLITMTLRMRPAQPYCECSAEKGYEIGSAARTQTLLSCKIPFTTTEFFEIVHLLLTRICPKSEAKPQPSLPLKKVRYMFYRFTLCFLHCISTLGGWVTRCLGRPWTCCRERPQMAFER